MNNILLALLVIAVIKLVFLSEYLSMYDKLLYKSHRLKQYKLEKLGLVLLESKKDRFYKSYRYRYKNIIIKVERQRYSIINIQGAVQLFNEDVYICDYKQLSKKFKSDFYNHYLSTKYPKILTIFFRISLGNNEVEDKLKAILKLNNLIDYRKNVSD
ncbi:hypothetical protein [Breznakia pachnodae]|uniref:Uncharacterized protein n=1 Tax=Breznakia pachnodae TaxID=265178 RepID=A0ABU0E6L3_9FIRM|nr:hypothetical protein [Breznakia pachnodae]MDQ0362552.1 hypothetical protein [Breznakia pachnodae]